MRFLFHAMLGLSIGVVGAGLVYGTVLRERVAHDGARGHRVHVRDAVARVPLERTLAAPIALFPRYGEPVTPGATLAWHLGDGTDGAQLELSSTPTFEPGSTRQIDVDGQTFKLPQGLPVGILYWRLRGRQGDVTGEQITPTWMVDVVAPVAEPAWG